MKCGWINPRMKSEPLGSRPLSKAPALNSAALGIKFTTQKPRRETTTLLPRMLWCPCVWISPVLLSTDSQFSVLDKPFHISLKFQILGIMPGGGSDLKGLGTVFQTRTSVCL